MKYYVDGDGNYIGGYDSAPSGTVIEIKAPPDDGRQKWDGVKFLPHVKSIQQKIYELENSVTPRNYREFVMGVEYSIDKINKVEADIAILRAKL